MSSISNMKLGSLFLLAILLTLNTRLQAIGVCEEQCREDRDCAAGEKCVSNGCGHVCSPAPQATICSIECSEDRDCGRGKECIQDGCRRICSPLMSVGVCEEQCREDRDCAAGEKCVGNGCGHVCSPAPQATICSIECSEDRDCGRGKECIQDGCRRICSPLMTVASLHLPRPYISHPATDDKSELKRDEPRGGPKQVSVRSSVERTRTARQERSICESQCFRDRDCGAGRRCVSEGCNRVCSPAPEASIGICVQRCRGNWDCGAGERCIRKGCSRVCSPVRIAGVGICLDQCQGHRDCPAGSRCVSNGCGRVCSPTQDRRAEQRPGTCPRVPEGTFGTCAERCTGDGSCPPGQKCCSNGCGKSCQVPDLGLTIHLDDK